MHKLRLSLLALCLATVSLQAQVPDERLPLHIDEPRPVDEFLVPEAPEEPSTTSSERKLAVFQNDSKRVASETFGINGALNDDTTGILLEAFTATPDLNLRIGKSDSTATLNLKNALNQALFSARGDGLMIWRVGGAEKMRLNTDGTVTINHAGTVGARLFVQHGTPNSKAIYTSHQPTIATNVDYTDEGLAMQTTQSVQTGATNSGRLYGIHAWTYMTGGGTLSRMYGAGIEYGTSTPVQGQGPGVIDIAYGLNLLSTRYAGSTINNGYGLYLSDVLATNDFSIFQVGSDDTNYFAGNIGLGTQTPAQKLHVYSGENAGTLIQVENVGTGLGAHAAFRTASTLASTSYAAHGNRDASTTRFGIGLTGWSEIVNFLGNGQIIGTTLNTPVVIGTSNLERMRIAADGNVGIGTTNPTAKLEVNGNFRAVDAYFSGVVSGYNIKANYQDVAEWVPATTDLEPGTVVVLNRERNNEVMASASSYDITVAGVVSAQPGLSLGVEGEGKEQIATTGRVKVRVDARHAPVAIGDLLVTSELPGTAMRSEPMEINGRKFHQPGTIIGKALEPLSGAIGEILVLLSMQ